MSVSDEIRRLKGKKSAELLARERRAAKRQAGRLEKHLQNNRAPGSMNDPWFMAQLRKAAQQAKERAGEAPRPDLDAAIAVAREKGHLPAAHEGKTGYVPTVEEILGDQATSKPPAPAGVETEDLPNAEDVLNGTPVDGSAFTAEELEEIRRLNPPRAMAPASSPHKHGKHQKRR